MQSIKESRVIDSESEISVFHDVLLPKFIETAFNNTSIGILYLGFGGEIRCFNKRILKILNVDVKETPSQSDIIKYSQKRFKNNKDLENLFKIPIKNYFKPQELVLETYDDKVLFCNSQPVIKDGLIDGIVWSVTDITEHKAQERIATHRSLHDPLTQLPNRTYLFQKLECLTSKDISIKNNFTLLFLDLDDFKTVNDQYGHNVGDQVLINFTSKLQTALRVPDILARLSGDEFIVILEGISTKKDVEKIIERIFSTLKGSYQIPNHDIPISVSIGASNYPQDSMHARELIRQADKAMYAAKSNGKNTFCFYSSSMES